MQDYIDSLRNSGKFSRNKVFRSYVDNKRFELPEDFQNARFLIVMAVYIPLAEISFQYQNRVYETFIPPNYRVQEFTIDQLRYTIARNIIGEEGHRIEDVRRRIFLKHLAVRSGLAEYGRNNICYVEDLGSMISLFAFLTDYVFEEDHWEEVRMMEPCRSCGICINQCPTQAISDSRFVIDVERCLPLYNEVAGEIPSFVPKEAHNSLMGCMRCQLQCPGNKETISHSIRLEGLNETETSSILEGAVNEESTRVLCQKLKVSAPDYVEQDLPVFSRNLKLLLRAHNAIDF